MRGRKLKELRRFGEEFVVKIPLEPLKREYLRRKRSSDPSLR